MARARRQPRGAYDRIRPNASTEEDDPRSSHANNDTNNDNVSGIVDTTGDTSMSATTIGGGNTARSEPETREPPRRTPRRRYRRISDGNDGENSNDENNNNEDSVGRNGTGASNGGRRLSDSSDSSDSSLSCKSKNSNKDGKIDDDNGDDEIALDTEKDDGRRVTVIVLDFAQNRFRVSACPAWTVRKFKEAGSAVHKVQSPLQRLIFRGKLLQDESTLEDSGITEDEVIVHLFPKPRVVIQSGGDGTSAPAESCSAASGDARSPASSNRQDGGDSAAGGAHVPTIVLDAEEAERRGQILVLGSADYVEAQNNVRLFSFMLLIISSIELLNLLAIAVGVPQQDEETGAGAAGYGTQDDWFNPSRPSTDGNDRPDMDPYSNSNSSSNGGYDYDQNFVYQPWGPANYVDLAISSLGVYVSVVGLKASTENTLRLAWVYLWGTVITGVSWMLFNYFVSVQVDTAMAKQHAANHPDDDSFQDLSRGDIYKQAVGVMILPGMVWLLCCARAWQFHYLLSEAEQEAAERIQQELSDLEQGGATVGAGSSATLDSSPRPVRHDEELALRNDQHNIT